MRKYFAAVSLLAVILLAFMTACGGGSHPIAVNFASLSSTSIPAGSSVPLTVTVSNDSKNGGVTWAISPSTCGTLTNTTTTSATYNTPAAATLNANCTATITATSVSDTTKNKAIALTAEAISVNVTSTAGTTTTFGSGAMAVTLTATLGNEATGASDSVTWSFGSYFPASSIRSKKVHANTDTATCGTLVVSTTNPEQATWTPPSELPSNCTATITAASTINSNQKAGSSFTVNAIALAITSPASAVTEYADKGAVSLTSTIANDGANQGVVWTLAAGSCGVLVQNGTSAIFTPPAAPAAQCTATATVTSVTDPTKSLAAPIITINPNIAVAFSTAPPTNMNEGATQAITASITNDLGNGGASWSLNPATGCGSLTGSGMTMTYTAGTPMTAACTVKVTATSVTDSTQSASANIAVTPTAVSITSPTGAQSVANSTVTALTASISNDGSNGGISWTIAPATGCGALSAAAGASINYTAPAEANLPAACTATITAASTYDSAKASSVKITANPIGMSAITSTSGTLPMTVGQGSAPIPLSATISYDTGGGIVWTPVASSPCGTMGQPTVSGNTSTMVFTPVLSVASNCVQVFTAASAADSTKVASTTITVTPLTVAITTPAGPVNVTESGMQSLVATVLGDVKNQGVTWGLNPATGCGTISATASASGASVAFTAPANTCTQTVTATSVTDTTKTASVVLTVVPPPISVTWQDAGPWDLDASNTTGSSSRAITANIQNDVTNKGIQWNMSTPNCATGFASASPGYSVYTLMAAQSSTITTSNCTVTITATSVADNTKFATGTLIVYPISVAITPGGSQNFAPGAANATFTAAVNDDALGTPGSANTGVTWSNSNTGCGLINNQTATSVTFVPPATGSPSCTTQLVATSVADTTKSNFDTITVGTVSTLTITTSDLQIAQGMATMPYGMNVNNNNAINGGNQPYSYSYTGLPTWATFDQNGNIMGTPTAAGSSTVTLTVTDNSSPKQQQSAQFTLPVIAVTSGVNNGMLSGQYACVIHQTWDSPVTVNGKSLYAEAIAVAFNSNGSGGITAGEADENSPMSGYSSANTIVGSYSVGADNRGYIAIGPGASQTTLWALAGGTTYPSTPPNYFTEFRLTQMDDVGASPSGRHGGGLCYKQYNSNGTAVTSTNNTLNGEAVTGGHVFLQNGEDSSGNWETAVGQISISGGTANGVVDAASGSGVTSGATFSGTMSTADQWGRIVFTCPTNCGSAVIYITNEALGQGVLMTTSPHNSGNDLQWGQIRAQNASAIAATYPITGPFVMYLSGLGTGGAQDSKAMLGHGEGSSTANTVNMDASIQNDTGTLSTKGPGVITYTVNPTTGRTTLSSSSGNTTGDVMYLYNTNEAVVLLADIGNGGGTTPQNMVGWLETQVKPTSGVWAFTPDLVGNYFMGDMYASGNGNNTQTGALTIGSTGSLSPFAQDDGGQNWADWDEGMGGKGSGPATGALALDPTMDPTGALGIYDINITQSGTTSTQVYCFAASVNTATNAAAYGRLICMDATSNNPKITIVAQ